MSTTISSFFNAILGFLHTPPVLQISFSVFARTRGEGSKHYQANNDVLDLFMISQRRTILTTNVGFLKLHALRGTRGPFSEAVFRSFGIAFREFRGNLLGRSWVLLGASERLGVLSEHLS